MRIIKAFLAILLMAWLLFVSLGGFVLGFIGDPIVTGVWALGSLVTMAIAFAYPGSIDSILDATQEPKS